MKLTITNLIFYDILDECFDMTTCCRLFDCVCVCQYVPSPYVCVFVGVSVCNLYCVRVCVLSLLHPQPLEYVHEKLQNIINIKLICCSVFH